MAKTFTLIASSTAGAGGTTAFDFTSIPATYTDLVVKWSVRQDLTTVAASDFIYFNGSQTSYSGKGLEGNGGGGSGASFSYTGNFTYANVEGNGASTTANTFANAEIYIPNYAGSSNKAFSSDGVMETNASTAYVSFWGGLWSNTAAINRVTISTSATNVTGGAQKFVQYSTAYLYGIKNS
jgi:hypothetical protein